MELPVAIEDQVQWFIVEDEFDGVFVRGRVGAVLTPIGRFVVCGDVDIRRSGGAIIRRFTRMVVIDAERELNQDAEARLRDTGNYVPILVTEYEVEEYVVSKGYDLLRKCASEGVLLLEWEPSKPRD